MDVKVEEVCPLLVEEDCKLIDEGRYCRAGTIESGLDVEDFMSGAETVKQMT